MKGLLLLLFPIFLFAQEQVSDIKHYGVPSPSFISDKVGFAEINGEQYLLQENDSLTIYKLQGSKFNVTKVIPNINIQELRRLTKDPNRSLYEIRDNQYFRFLNNALQIIDIAEGEIIKEYDLSSYDDYELEEITSERVYLSDRSLPIFALDLSTSHIDSINIESPHSSQIRSGDQVLGITKDSSISIYNSVTKIDTVLFQPPAGIKETSYSRQDSSFLVFENDGSVWKIFQNLAIKKFEIKLSDWPELKSYWVNGDYLIEIYIENTIPFDNSHKVIVTDLNSGEQQMNFNTGEFQFEVEDFHNVTTETNDTRYSIIGFNTYHNTDDLNESRYYILDHQSRSEYILPALTRIKNHTPFIHENKMYMVAYSTWYLGFREFIVSCDLLNNETKYHYPYGNQFSFSTIGFPNEKGIINASIPFSNYYWNVGSNSLDEEVKVWKLNADDDFTVLSSLGFSKNLGAVDISDKEIISDKLYFKSSGGLYSVEDKAILHLGLERKSNRIPASYPIKDPEILVSDNKLCILDYNTSEAVFKVYNTDNGNKDSLFIDERISSKCVLGEYLAYYDYGERANKKFDPQDMSISKIFSLSFSHLSKGNTRSISIESNFANNEDKAYLFNYDDNVADQLILNINKSIYAEAGYDDAFYLIDDISNNLTTRIRLIDKDNNISTLYDGKGYPYDMDYDNDQTCHPVSLIHLMVENEKSILVTNNLDTTEIIEITNNQIGSTNQTIINRSDEKFILYTVDSLGDHYWYYEAFKPLVEILNTNDKSILYSEFTDDSAMIWLRKSGVQTTNGPTTLVTYNFESKETTSIDILVDCSFPETQSGLYIGANKFVMNSDCGQGFEPYILDINEGTYELIGDINLGIASSSPSDFIIFKNQLYFTAIIKDGSRQWFRALSDIQSEVSEININTNEKAIAYPSPSKNSLSVNNDASKLQVFSLEGQLLLERDNYIKDEVLDISNLISGMYLIRMEDSQSRISTIKFVKTE